ncbi:hypothetical protein SAMN05216257_105186 [Meinhardsimonia xiamenensis]|jgi:hypothetical protein|uniref:N-acetyltransferase domain-containing protein n=1 Tax=Meinhardsimonia xiamenensis TaxID=990712 RepID=A0A1G9FHQ9_9RHOB|nr:hypothetical protein [Meinhardsimonia xiamenensis]PRX37849.1 hypothetical protein LV81_00117 [Meinhardsimonia xiamenensis]SDK87683.1 hypothetical protein SAMN05216257_105186 [Meinhardsimonia xiamenensis]
MSVDSTATPRRGPGARAARRRGLIRPLEPRDRAAVREIACRTAFRNMGAARMFEDLELHADYWTAYYTDHYPEDSRVIEQEGRVIGYFFGCPDHAHFTRVMARRIVPRVVGKALWRLATRQYKQPQTGRYLRHMLLHGAREAPRIPYAQYPATYHCNILREGYGQGYYTELVLDYLDRLEARGITGIHGHITEPAGSRGVWHRFAKEVPGVRVAAFDERPTRLFEVVLGETTPMVNRAWAFSIADYRAATTWLRETKGL